MLTMLSIFFWKIYSSNFLKLADFLINMAWLYYYMLMHDQTIVLGKLIS